MSWTLSFSPVGNRHADFHLTNGEATNVVRLTEAVLMKLEKSVTENASQWTFSDYYDHDFAQWMSVSLTPATLKEGGVFLVIESIANGWKHASYHRFWSAEEANHDLLAAVRRYRDKRASSGQSSVAR